MVFLAVPLISTHQVKPKDIYQSIENPELAASMENQLRPVMVNKVNAIQLQRTINKSISAVNQTIRNKYSISNDQVDGLVDLAIADNLNQESISTLLSGEENEFQRTSFNDYGNWLYGKDFTNRDAATKAINEVRDNIIKYELETKFGFDRYQKKDVKYNLSKASVRGLPIEYPWLFLLLTYGLISAGALGLGFSQLKRPAGINNDNVFKHPATSRKWLGIIIGTFLIGFYVLLYFYPEYLTSWVAMVDPISILLKGSPAGQFFLYGFLYTLCVLVMGVRMLIKYRDNRYQIFRTLSVMFFQTTFAFLIPEILVRLNQPYFDFKNIWPLDYDFFFDFELAKLISSGQLGVFMLVWGIALITLAVPIFTYFFGKRWYCSWVCGCGGLAETLGDPFRHLSDKSMKAWNIEQVSIYLVLVFAIVMTGGVLHTYFTGTSTILGINTFSIREIYGGLIGAGFAGVVGTGFYPFMGNRVWCRFGCPLAAYIGIIQRFKSRFRITTNGGQCISCGNCSTYCEMGIDVRAYAQKGENIVRASCVGCGVCSAVCPRGVLKLENVSTKNRFEPNGFIK